VAWNQNLKTHGPNSAFIARDIYQRWPRQDSARSSAAEPKEEDRNEDDHMASARKAFREVSRRQSPEDRDRALAGIDALEREHGTLGVIPLFNKWHQQLSANPQDAAPRIATEIANHVNDSILNQQAHQTVRDYKAQHQISPDEHSMMQHVLLNGWAADMKDAHKMARHLLALDVEDGYQRSVTAAQRQIDMPEDIQAKAEVEAWERRNPNASNATRGRMRKLLLSEQARTLDEAYRMARDGA
jgi:hypothetical protein